MDNIDNEVYKLLRDIQLENFWPKISQDLQITRISHFDYVKPKDLEKIGLSKPAIRRLMDLVIKTKKPFTPSRAPPPPPVKTASPQTNGQSSLIKVLSASKLTSFLQKGGETIRSDPSQKGVSFVINPKDIEFIKNKNGEEILGAGNFGVVKKGIWSSPNGKKINVAIKCLHDSNFDSNNSDKRQAMLDIINEITCMCGLDHLNLIKLYGVILNGSNSGNSIISMVTELASFGSLLKYLHQNREYKKLPIRTLYSYVYQIADGMEYLENKNLIHRDLAARNILLSTLEHVKICDFGMSRNVVNGLYTMTESHKIPCAWYPPESIREKVFSIKSDVWAYGVTMWEIFSFGEQPWPNMTAAEMLKKIDSDEKRLSIPYMCSKNFYKIISSCWSKLPNDRPSFKILKKLIKEFKIIELKAKSDFKDENRLELIRGDMITIIDGSADRYWWKGQNNRTLLTGSFPRALLDTQRKLNGEDISMPLKNSFIHTGHMGADSKNVWGNPGKIDEIFLRNPLNPPDFLGDIDEEKCENKDSSSEFNSSSSCSNSIFDDLIGLFDHTTEIKVSHPSFSPEIPTYSFSEKVSPVKSQSETFYQNQNYFPGNPTFQNFFQPQQSYQNYNYHRTSSQEVTSNDRPQIYRATNPFLEDNNFEFSNGLDNSLNLTPVNTNFIPNNVQLKPRFNQEFEKHNFANTNKKENIDDLLQKVMSDVFNEFKTLKNDKN